MGKRKTLKESKGKYKNRIRGRKRQLRKYEKTGKKGHKKEAAKHGRAARKLKEIIDRLVAFFRRRPKPGEGPWGGSKSIVEQEIIPIAKRHGIAVTSKKRWETYGNPGSDHYRGNATAYAADFATANNYALAAEIGRKLGFPYQNASDDYKSYYIRRAGRNYRVQLIAGTHGTGPHLHAGVKLV